MCSALRVREAEILTATMEERVDGGMSIPQQQRAVEDAQYMRLSSIIDGISRAVRELPSHQQRAIILVYFVGMGKERASFELDCDLRTIRRRCFGGIKRMSLPLFALYSKVAAWRDEEADRMLKKFGLGNST